MRQGFFRWSAYIAAAAVVFYLVIATRGGFERFIEKAVRDELSLSWYAAVVLYYGAVAVAGVVISRLISPHLIVHILVGSLVAGRLDYVIRLPLSYDPDLARGLVYLLNPFYSSFMITSVLTAISIWGMERELALRARHAQGAED